MKKALILLLLAATAAACSRSSEGSGARLRTDTDSVAYVIGMNVGLNLLRTDSTLNVAALCEGIRDAFREKTRLTPEEAEAFFLGYMNYTRPEQARAYEEEFLDELARRERSFARTRSGITYAIAPEELGNQERLPAADRDSLQLRYRIVRQDGRQLYSSYDRGDTIRTIVGDLKRGLQEAVKLIGEGGRITAWIPSKEAYGADGNPTFDIAPNSTVCFEIELVKLDKYAEWNRRRN